MASSGSVTSKKYNGAYWYFTWSSAKNTTPGESTVTWEIWAKGRSSAPKWYASDGTASITSGYGEDGSYSLSKSLDGQSKWDGLMNFDNQKIHSGSFVLKHNSSGVAKFSFKFDIDKIYATGTYDASDTFTLDTNYPYTACGAPTKVEVNKSIQKPGGSVTISWSGATNGTANPIKNYTLEYKKDSGWNVISSTISGTSHSWTLPSGNRGSTYSFRVKANGTQSSYSSGYKEQGSVIVNTQPNAPSVTASSTVIPSAGGEVTFTVTAGSSNNTGQSTEVYYSKDSGDKTKLSGSTLKVTLSSGATYKFWTKDGLEYSENYTSKTITKNTAPTFTLEISGDDCGGECVAYFKNGKSGAKYSFGYTYNGTKTTLVSKTSSTSFTIGDIRHWFGKTNALNAATYTYTYWAKAYDDYENYSRTSGEKSFTIPILTAGGTVGDDDEVLGQYFHKDLHLTIGEESDTFAKYNYQTIEVNGSKFRAGSGHTQHINFGGSPPAYGAVFEEVGINNKSTDLYPFKVKLKQAIRRIEEFQIELSEGATSPFSPTTYYPYSTENLIINIKGHLGPEYGLEVPPPLTLVVGEASLAAQPQTEEEDTFRYSFSGQDLYDKFFTLDSNRKATLSTTLKIENLYGVVFTRDFSLKLNFKEEPTVRTLSIFPGNQHRNEPLDAWSYLKEGMPIHCTLDVVSFDDIKQVEFGLEKEGTNEKIVWGVKTVGDFDDPRLEGQDFIDINNEEYSYNARPKIFSLSQGAEELMGQLGQIEADYSARVYVKVSTIQNKTKTYWPYPTPLEFKAFYPASAYYSTASFTSSGNGQSGAAGFINAVVGITDYGGDIESDQFQAEYSGIYVAEQPSTPILFAEAFPLDTSSSILSLEEAIQVTFVNEEALLWHITPRITSYFRTTLKPERDVDQISYFETTKFSQTDNAIVIYNLTPTVCYRKNSVGINVRDPNSWETPSAAFVVGAANGKNKAYFMGDSGIIALDLLTGEISGAVLSGGNWNAGQTISINSLYIDSATDKTLKSSLKPEYYEYYDERGQLATYAWAPDETLTRYDYQVVNGRSVPVLFVSYEDDSTGEILEDDGSGYVYLSSGEIDGQTMDKWKTVSLQGGSNGIDWGAAPLGFIYTQHIVNI